MTAAARITDMQGSPNGVPSTPIVEGAPTVIIGYQPAAREGDRFVGHKSMILRGEPSVLIGDDPAARVSDPTESGVILTGCPTVLIGSNPQAKALQTERPFVEDCEECAKRRQREQG